jgi:hypothetical protein
MVVAAIGTVALVASIGSWFPTGIVLGIGLIALGLAIEFVPGKSR